jgi:hypothetical protein
MDSKTTGLIGSRSTLGLKYIYAPKYNSGDRTDTFTGEQSCHQVPGYEFKDCCRWSELPGGSLLITGGGLLPVGEVVQIDTLRECAVSSQPPLHSVRGNHAAVYHSQYLYVLGGYRDDRVMKECERFVCAESLWEVLPALPKSLLCYECSRDGQ